MVQAHQVLWLLTGKDHNGNRKQCCRHTLIKNRECRGKWYKKHQDKWKKRYRDREWRDGERMVKKDKQHGKRIGRGRYTENHSHYHGLELGALGRMDLMEIKECSVGRNLRFHFYRGFFLREHVNSSLWYLGINSLTYPNHPKFISKTLKLIYPHHFKFISNIWCSADLTVDVWNLYEIYISEDQKDLTAKHRWVPLI